MTSEWKREIYKGHKGGPPVNVCETILRAAGVEVLPLQEVRARLLARDDQGCTVSTTPAVALAQVAPLDLAEVEASDSDSESD